MLRSSLNSLFKLSRHPAVVAIGLLAAAVLPGLRLFLLVNQKAVNLLYWDQFDFYRPLFNGQGWADQFFWQHGIHRQGLGGILTRLVADASGWNGRAEAFVILGLVYLSLGLVLLLRWRLAGRFSLADMVYPLLVLNIYQYEIFIGTTNIAPAGLSLFLLCLYGVCWTLRRPALRYAAVLAANFLAVFSGYSMFLGIITVLLLLLELGRALWQREKAAAQLAGISALLSLLTVALFFNGYQFFTTAGCTELSFQAALRVPLFMSLMQAKFIGLNYTESAAWSAGAGIPLLLLTGATGVWSLIEALRRPAAQRPLYWAAAGLIGFTLLYSAAAALGRSCLGMAQAQPSRYVTLLIPGFVGLFLVIQRLPFARVRAAVFAIGLVLVLHSLWPFPAADQWVVDFYSSGKSDWKACYLQGGSAADCQQKTGFQVYPYLDERIRGELDFLKEHRLNLYLDAAPGAQTP